MEERGASDGINQGEKGCPSLYLFVQTYIYTNIYF